MTIDDAVKAADGLIFDLDGTLLNSAPDVHWAVNQTLKELELPERSLEEVESWMGNGIAVLLARAISGKLDGDADTMTMTQGLGVIKEIYADHCHDKSVLYAGCIELLESLRKADKKLALVTNKPILHTTKIIRHFDIKKYFQVVLGGDSLPAKKPDPLPLLKAREMMDVANCLVVGDSVNDQQAALAAEMPFVGMSYGYNHGMPLDCEHQAKSLTELFIF